MVALIIFLILVFILYELYFFNLEKFSGNSDYDHYFDGTIFMSDNETPTNIGIGTEPNSEYMLDVNGKLTINGNLQVGQAILNYDLAKKLNKLPLYTRNEYCLYEPDGVTKQCINEDQLGMITGHNKVMFKNRYGEVLSNLKLKHHGLHTVSEGGRPYTGSNPWHEGFIFRDFDVSGHTYENDYWTRGYRNNSEQNTLENSSESTPSDNNQFKLIPISNIDTRIVGDESDVKNIILYHPGSRSFIRPQNDSFIKKDGMFDFGNGLWELDDNITNTKKIQIKQFIEDGHHGSVYLKLQKIPNSEQYYIRVKNATTNKWRYLRSRNDNYLIDPEDILTDYPTGVNRFTIKNLDTGEFNINSIKQFVTIEGSTGKNLCIGTWDDYVYGAYGMRYLSKGAESDWKFLMYIENIDVGDGEEEDFVPQKEYTCSTG